MYPYSNPSFFAKSLNFLKNIKWTELLDNTGKTLGVINQAIPVVYQVKPILTNAKTLLKIAGSMNNSSNETPKQEEKKTKNSPIFYI